jgi:hypothetical protein
VLVGELVGVGVMEAIAKRGKEVVVGINAVGEEPGLLTDMNSSIAPITMPGLIR